ncbi:hypothetical protein [Pedobacter agri]|uniref:ImmA/IrrE family metallo-endopeptidase n=1 Tax=Pedobacter agri TaxID=454586 RepID=UPI00292DCDC8|nr:hypothetical protein [Pedobacter agri]
MKRTLTLLMLVCLCKLSFAQTDKWFGTYRDSIALVTDADKIIKQLAEKISKADVKIDLSKNFAVKNTTPNLIFINYKKNTVNLPFWDEVITPQKKFFHDVAVGETEGKEVFGLFFNGFYLAHELGHSFFAIAGKKFDNSYDSEYEANKFAVLYWQSVKEKKNLKKCYDYAQKMLKTLKNPVPEHEDYKKYITENYSKLASDPRKYGYIQFSQFVEIYKDKKLPDFKPISKNTSRNQNVYKKSCDGSIQRNF